MSDKINLIKMSDKNDNFKKVRQKAKFTKKVLRG